MPHDYITNVQKRLGNRVWTRRNLQHRRSHSRTLRMSSRCGLRFKTCRPYGTQRGSQLRNPGRLIFSPPLLSQDAVRLWMCVRHLPMKHRPEETQGRQRLIENCLPTGMKSQTFANKAFTIDPLSGRRMGGPHPAVTRTLQYASEIASSRNDQQMPAKSLQRRWKLGAHTPAAWIQVFKQRLSLWCQQQSQLSQRPLLSLVPPDVLTRGAQDVADVYCLEQPVTVDSRPSLVGGLAWFLSCAFWICLQVAGVCLR